MAPKQCYNFLSSWILLFLLLPGLALSESNTQETGYVLGSGDVLSLTIIAGGEEQAKADLVVSNAGEVNIPFIGKVKAAGLSLSDFEQKIFVPLERDYFVKPQIYLLITEYHSLSFFISGAIRQPGMYEMDFTPTVMDLIAKAGGVLSERGNIAYILPGTKRVAFDKDGNALETSEKNPKTIDLIELLDRGDMTGNSLLTTGDTIYIPHGNKLNQSGTKIYVEGEVKSPGVFDYQPGLTALAVCIMAGGFDKYAAPSRTRVIRNEVDGQVIIKIDLEKVTTGDLGDQVLKPGDRIHVPETWL